MNDHDHDDDGAGEVGNGHSPSVADPVLIAFTLIDLALNPKAAKAGLTQLVKLDKDIGAAEQKLAALTAQTEQTKAALDERAAELDTLKAAITKREDEFANSLADARSELYAHHNRVEQAHRQLVHRIMSTAGIAGNWNFDLQDPPTWQQLRRMIADLPDDLPATPPADVVSENVREDWVGHTFVPGSTLTRSIIPKATGQ
jgi:hypothetical protein